MEKCAAEYLVNNCIESFRKKILVIYDDTTKQLVNIFYLALLKCEKSVEIVKLDVAHCHGEEPTEEVANRILSNEAVMCLTQRSLAHTQARRNAEKKGIAFLSMPEYTIDLLNNRAIYADYYAMIPQVKKYTDLLTNGDKVVIETEIGTCLYLNIKGRVGNCCPGMTNRDYLLGSPPDIEANIAPIENRTNGRVIVDGSIADKRIGLLKEPVILDIKEGYVYHISCQNKEVENLLKKIFVEVHAKNAYIVGEFGIGFNDCAKLCGNMLIDEGAKGCIHFGMGSNWTIGGTNRVPFHLDFVLKGATVKVDNKMVIDQGVLIYDK